ncbi:histidinol dehydrogenase [Yoonia sp. BS5-3]|uniref:Histidinol dehydrogenase n=1 Tax=Yoonia phaeophyticola TaxID=3137369 RepID=A0ABZ2V7I0_9RHOB
MSHTYLKKALRTAESDAGDVREIVEKLLQDIHAGGEGMVRELALKFDKWDGDIVVSAEQVAQAETQVPEALKRDIQFAHDNIRRFAEKQLSTIQDCTLEVVPGFSVGQKQIPIEAAGCYVPGGRYSHLASAIMTVTTAKVAGVKHITAVSPPRPGVGIPPAILYTLNLCGADTMLNLGGVQGIAAMAQGLFGCPKAAILVGPGNQFVAEAKRILFGEVGIDMFAGPTDSLIIADKTADPALVAADLVGQAEHGYNSPVWLITDDEILAKDVMDRVPNLIADLPQLNRVNAEASWRDYAEVILCSDRDEMRKVSDTYAPEHLQVMADDLDWWLNALQNYGSLFLGEHTTVAFGDKSAGTNHVLPTSGAARYTGGLSVHKFIKTVTWQRADAQGMRPVAEATARISRLEGMEGHARTAVDRLQKYFPGEEFDLG